MKWLLVLTAVLAVASAGLWDSIKKLTGCGAGCPEGYSCRGPPRIPGVCITVGRSLIKSRIVTW